MAPRLLRPARTGLLTAVAGVLSAGLLVAPGPAAAAAPGDPDLVVAQFRDQVVRLAGADGSVVAAPYPGSDDVTAVHRTPSGVTFVAEDGGRVLRYPAGRGRPATLSEGGPDVLGMAAAPDGTLYVGRSGGGDHGLERITTDGISSMLVEDVDVTGVALRPDGAVLAVTGDDPVIPGTSPGLLLVREDSLASTPLGLGFAAAVAVDPSGATLVTDNADGAVWRFVPEEDAELVGRVPGAFGLAATAAGDVVVTSDSGDRVVVVREGGSGPEVLSTAVVNPVSLSVVTAPAATTTVLTTRADRLVARVTSTGTTPPGGPVTFTAAGDVLGTATLVPDPEDPLAAVATWVGRVPMTPDPVEIAARFDGDLAHTGSRDTYTRTDPTVQVILDPAAPDASGWYRTPVSFSFRCTAGSSPVQCPDPGRVTADGVRVVRGTARGADGGSATVSRTVRVDRTPPDLVVRGLGQGPYPPGSRPLRCSVADATSGPAGCRITYERSPEQRRVTWRAVGKDVAGNTSTRTGTFRTPRTDRTQEDHR